MSFDAEEIRALEPELWRAPSPHNTQPWMLAYGDDDVTLHWDPARTLPVADPTMRDNFLALGAFVETVETVTADAGCALLFETDIDVSPRVERAGRFAPGDAYVTPFGRGAVAGRLCSRLAYAPGVIDPLLLEHARGAASLHPAARRLDVQLVHVPARALIVTLVDADRHMFGDPAVTMELRDWMRLTRRHPRYHQDGLTWEAMALKRSEAVALRTLLAPPVYRSLRRVGLPGMLAASAKPLLDYDGSVLVLTGPAPEANEPAIATHAVEMQMGRALMRTWLQLASDGLSVHPLSEIIDAPATYAALASTIELPADRRAFAIFRAGRTVAPPAPSSRVH